MLKMSCIKSFKFFKKFFSSTRRIEFTFIGDDYRLKRDFIDNIQSINHIQSEIVLSKDEVQKIEKMVKKRPLYKTYCNIEIIISKNTTRTIIDVGVFSDEIMEEVRKNRKFTIMTVRDFVKKHGGDRNGRREK